MRPLIPSLIPFVFGLLALLPCEIAAQPDPAGAIAPIRDGLYRVTVGKQVTVFLATPEGIVLVDPLNPIASAWLKAEFAGRFPNVPVRYLVYTHRDYARSSGASVFDRTAEIVAHDRFDAERQRVAGRMPLDLTSLDRNGSLELERDEWVSSPDARTLGSYDRDEDGVITLAELSSHILTAEAPYRSQRTLTVGGQHVHLIHVPHPEALDLTWVYFQEQRVLFASDGLAIASVPASLGRDPRQTIAAAKLVETLDFDTIVTGSGDAGTKADVTVFREYVTALRDGVQDGFNRGRTAEEIASTLTLERFSGLANFMARRPANIREVYSHLQPTVTMVDAAASIKLSSRTAPRELGGCDSRLHETCLSTSNAPFLSGVISVNRSIGRLMITGEIGGDTTQVHRLRQIDDFFPPSEAVRQHREATLSGLLGYTFGRANGTVVRIQGGPTYVISKNGWVSFSPGQRFSFPDETNRSLGATGGLTFSTRIAHRLSIVFPVRFTVVGRGSEDISRVSLTAGGGVRLTVAHTGPR